jgi:magnesium transporter
MSLDCAYYESGIRQLEPLSVAEAAALPRRGGRYVWVEADDPSPDEMAQLGESFGLHELALEDAGRAHERPKVEAYDDFYFLVFRTAECDPRNGRTIFGELDVFVGVGYVVAVRHGSAGSPIEARLRLEQRPDLLRRGPAAVVWGILDLVVDAYFPVLEAIEVAVDEIERVIFDQDTDLTQRIYTVQQELNHIYRAIHPLLAPLEGLERGTSFPELADPELRRYFRDIGDHLRHGQDEVLHQRDRLKNALEAHLSLMAHHQNLTTIHQNRTIEQLTLVATVFLPITFVTGFFGQNFAWLVSKVGSLAAFLTAGIGSIAVAIAVTLLWLARTRSA